MGPSPSWATMTYGTVHTGAHFAPGVDCFFFTAEA